MTEKRKPWRDAEPWLHSWLEMERDDETLVGDFHGAFIPAVAESFIQRLTKPGDWVWDPMAGGGTTGRVCERMNRNCYMTDLTPKQEQIFQGDARSMMVSEVWLGGNKVPMIRMPAVSNEGPPFLFDLILLHPPYHDIVEFSTDLRDLSKCGTVGAWQYAMREVAMTARAHLKPGGWVGLVLGDLWNDAQAIPLGFIGMNQMRSCGFTLKAIQMKNIGGNRANAHRENLLLSRFYRWGAVRFEHEYLFTFKAPK